MTIIVAKYVNPAKPDKKFGSIVDPNGAKFMLPVGMQDAFQAGQTYDVPTSRKNWGQDVVTVIEGRPGSAGSTAPATPPPPAPAASAPPAGHNSARMSNVDPKDVFIFVTGVVGRAMGSGKYDVSDIDLLTKAAIEAYRNNLARAVS